MDLKLWGVHSLKIQQYFVKACFGDRQTYFSSVYVCYFRFLKAWCGNTSLALSTRPCHHCCGPCKCWRDNLAVGRQSRKMTQQWVKNHQSCRCNKIERMLRLIRPGLQATVAASVVKQDVKVDFQLRYLYKNSNGGAVPVIVGYLYVPSYVILNYILKHLLIQLMSLHTHQVLDRAVLTVMLYTCSTLMRGEPSKVFIGPLICIMLIPALLRPIIQDYNYVRPGH